MKINISKSVAILFFYTSLSFSAPPAPPPPGLPPPGVPIDSDISKFALAGVVLGIFLIRQKKT